MISLIHPSRGRPEKSLATTLDWASLCSGDIDIELIVSIDRSDSKAIEYLKVYSEDCPVIINNNTCVVEATNNAAEASKGGIMVYLSDDFASFKDWDKAILKEFEGHAGPMVLKVDDCLQSFRTEILTIPIMNRAAYKLLGYFFHPGYKSMFCDEHLYHRCNKLGILKMAPHLKFEHRHVSVGKAENDETYRRSAANWDQGKRLFERHKRIGFIE